MNYSELIKRLNLTEDDAMELVSYGTEAIDHSFKIYDQYLKDGKEIPRPFPFLRKVCQNFLEKKKKSANQFNQTIIEEKEPNKEYHGPQMKSFEIFVWREDCRTPEDFAREDMRFEEWLRSEDGGEYLRVYGLKEIPEHFQEFAREVIRYNHQMRRKRIDDTEEVRPIAPRRLKSHPGYNLHDNTQDSTERHWKEVIAKHVPCMIKSNRVTIDYLPVSLRDYANKLCNEFLGTYGHEAVETSVCIACLKK